MNHTGPNPLNRSQPRRIHGEQNHPVFDNCVPFPFESSEYLVHQVPTGRKAECFPTCRAEFGVLADRASFVYKQVSRYVLRASATVCTPAFHVLYSRRTCLFNQSF